MAKPKKVTEAERAVLARRLKHAREVKARKRKVAAAMKEILTRQPELRAAAEEKLAREAAGEELPFVLH